MREWLSNPDNQFAAFLLLLGAAIVVRAVFRWMAVQNGAPRHRKVIDYTGCDCCPDCPPRGGGW